MRLSCPECQTEYEVPDAALAGRPRTLRCANCGKTWKTEAPPAAAQAIQAAQIAPSGPEAAISEPQSQGEATLTPGAPEPLLSAARLKAVREAQAAKQAEPPPANTGLKISILVLIVLIVLVLAEHRAIMTAWPPSTRLFNALGLH